jgi:hypothetical protein
LHFSEFSAPRTNQLMYRVIESPNGSRDGRVTTPPLLPTTASPGEVYASRLATQHDEQHRLEHRYGELSGWRRVLLGALVVLIILVEGEGLLAKLALIAAPALVLGHLIIRRARVAR